MFRIDVPSAFPNPPAMPAVGTPGFFGSGDPFAGIMPTEVPAWWLHMVTEELHHLVVFSGLTPDKSDLNQIRKAIERMIGPRRPATTRFLAQL